VNEIAEIQVFKSPFYPPCCPVCSNPSF